MTDPTGPTYPDRPPLVDERTYQLCVRTIAALELRGDPYDTVLLRTLRRACELYEQSRPAYGRTLLIQACDCGECTECQLRAELAQRTERFDSQRRADGFRLEKGRERIAFLGRSAGLWKRAATLLWRRGRETARLYSATVRERNTQAMELERVAKEREEFQDDLIRCMQERKALEVALEAALVNQGAGTSPYARSQPSDACEIEMWKAHAEGAWEDNEALKARFTEARMDVLVAQAEVKAWRNCEHELLEARAEVKAWRTAHAETMARIDQLSTHYKHELLETETEVKEIEVHAMKSAQRIERERFEIGRRLHVKRAEALHWQRQYAGCFEELERWIQVCKKREQQRDQLHMDVHVLRMERDNAEAEAEALKVKLAFALEDVDRANAALVRECSAQTVLRQELKASRAAHEQAMRERDDWHKLADDRARELCGVAPQTPMGEL